jgi:putative aldouronate transport system substrate-binding protein
MKKLSTVFRLPAGPAARLIPVLALMLIPGMIFAGGGSQGKAGVTTISAFPMWSTGQSALEETKWYADFLRDNLGIALELRSAPGGEGEQFVNTMVASNSMTDLFPFRDSTVIQNITGTGKLINLMDYQDKLPNLFKNPLYEKAIAYYRDTYGGPNRALYCIPTSVGPNTSVDFKNWMRYDWYKEIGSPVINTLEDYLQVLKRIQDAHPTNADGQKVYGMSLWHDWDKQSAAPVTYIATTFGYDVEYVSHLCQTYVDGSRPPISILDDSGPYKRVLKFFYTMNQMGLLDPDSATQNFDTAAAKSTAGRVIFQHWDWFGTFNSEANKNAGIGFMPVPRKDQKSTIDPDMTTGQNWVWGIPKNTKKLDAALKFLDFFCSVEGTDLIFNGPKGLIWDVDSSGKRYITDKGWDILAKNTETHEFGQSNQVLGSILNADNIYPPTGQTLGYGGWDGTILHNNNSQLYRTWRADHNNAVTPHRWMIDQGMTVKYHLASRLMPALPTDLENIMTQIGDVVKTNSWRAIFAKNEAEFDALWKDAQTKANGLGMQRILEWTIQAWNQAKANTAKYQ